MCYVLERECSGRVLDSRSDLIDKFGHSWHNVVYHDLSHLGISGPQWIVLVLLYLS